MHLDEIRSRFAAGLQAVSRWAASDDGQHVLAGVDYALVSTKVGNWCAHVGWYLPLHPECLRYALMHLRYHAPFDARDAERLVGPNSDHWSWIVAGVVASPSIQSRKSVVEDVIWCMEEGRWHAAVSTALPVLEGVIADASGILARMRVDNRFERLLHSDELDIPLALSSVTALRVLNAEVFGNRSFQAAEIEETALNRHLILHGRTAGYGTSTNASRVFMLLVALLELLDGPLVLGAGPTAGGIEAVLDEFGPLASLRMAAISASSASQTAA